MNKSIFGVVGFVLGAAVGSLVTWKLIEKKYMDMADEEIRSVKEMYRSKANRVTDDEVRDISKQFVEEDRSRIHYEPDETGKKLINRLDELTATYASDDEKPDYTAYSQAKQTETKDTDETDIPSEKPYIISPDEFDEIGYTICELTYYSGNGVLVDEDGEPIENPERTVGTDFSNHFGEYEDDAVFVRNDRLMSDYQILLDRGAY